jgi:2-polyprenyl-3-methyl-5-hydroxy-6-metoxy-1,4-benzoquinol methylase
MAETGASQSEQRDALVGRLLPAFQGAIDIFAIYLGERLGYYRALATDGPATASELATRTASNERYAREWLEQQAASGFLTVDDARMGPDRRRFTLPAGHREVLVDTESLAYLAPLAHMVATVGRKSDAVIAAYKSGGGISWGEFGQEMREAQAAQNKPLFLGPLTQEFLPAIPDVQARLLGDPPARVADLACGFGWSSIGIAKGYPKVRVDGFDLDAPSVAAASANAREHGVAGRVRFEARDAADPALAGTYDLVTIFEALHDMSQPVDVLRAGRRMLAPGGTMLVIDEKTDEEFAAPGSDLDRLFYGFSLMICLPDGMSHSPSAATGTVMRPATLRAYARAAGFKDIEALPIDAGFFRFYRLLTA